MTTKRILSVLLTALFLLFTGCSAPEQTPHTESTPTAEPTAAPTPEAPAVTHTLRVIASYEGGGLLLADVNNRAVYHNALPDSKIYPAGTLLEVTCADYVLETYPAQLAEIYEAEPIDDGFDDRCALYLQVFEDLWEEDQALQADIDYIGIDLSRTSLTKSEQDALAWRFGELKGKEVLTGTFDELCEQGFINKEELYWENGCLLSIEEEGLPDEESDTNKVIFRAQKWRSGLGAIMFTSCTAEQDKTGHWGEYTAGGFAIA
ncbi:MAG: hypothetical protein J6S41_08300 [Clostridia bacterium]|nr:hypothetical protein [Clostridia bacterium]